MLKFLLFFPILAHSFCGFFVSKADTKLFNKASKVVLVRDENKTVMTVASDFKGDVKDFAMVLPVPSILEKGQIKVVSNKTIDHLDQYSSPRLVEYFDADPCMRREKFMVRRGTPMLKTMAMGAPKQKAKSLGVTIEKKYSVGEYDILILSAKESSGLLTWLNQNKYKLPAKAKPILNSYIKQGLKFFIAKVNLEKFESSGQAFLKPIRIAYESKRYSVPVRLGTINADGDQELFIFALTKSGRVESTNYQSQKLDSNKEVPIYVKKDFSKFYKAMFTEMVRKHGKNKLYLEYAWNMNWCDPCAADPLTTEELRELGVFWAGENQGVSNGLNKRIMPPRGGAAQVYITRMHARYNSDTFPEDISFQSTPDKTNFQGRYIINHPWKGKKSQCKQAENYFTELNRKQSNRAKNLANLTGWDVNEIRSKMKLNKIEKKDDKPWWKF